MSEIIASVYDCMRTTGKTQGILFLDEINCVSETLSPAMLLFLQYKVFGGHQIPEGWVVVTAGNPPRFNKSVREFDAATRDRLKVIEVEPSYEAWKAYALEHGVSRSVISYLDIRPEDFYKVETTVDGLTVVTPRAWEDLSEILQYHEELGLAVSEELTTQYLQNKQVARDFAIYYELYQKYRQAYNIDAILQGVWDEDVLTQARSAKMDERMSLVSLLLEAVFLQMERCTLRHDALCLIVAALKAQRGTLDVPGDALTALAGLEDNWRAEANKAPSARQKVYLDLLSLTAQWHGELSGSTPFSALKACYQRSVANLQVEVAETQKKLGDLLRFLQEAFGKGTELSMAVNDLTVAPVATAFLLADAMKPLNVLSKFENHFAIRTVRFQVQLEADGYFSAQKFSSLQPQQAGRVGTTSQVLNLIFYTASKHLLGIAQTRYSAQECAGYTFPLIPNKQIFLEKNLFYENRR